MMDLAWLVFLVTKPRPRLRGPVCSRDACGCPTHVGDLCGRCFAGANDYERATALLIHHLEVS